MNEEDVKARNESLGTLSGAPPSKIIVLAPARYVQINVFSAITGYTKKACDSKRHNGVWVEGREYIKAPDGHILMDMKGYERWVEKGSPE